MILSQMVYNMNTHSKDDVLITPEEAGSGREEMGFLREMFVLHLFGGRMRQHLRDGSERTLRPPRKK